VHLRQVYGTGVNDFIKSAVGLLLVLIPTLLLFQGRIEEHLAKREPTMKSFAFMSVIGLVGGFLVGITFGRVGQHHHDVASFVLFVSLPRSWSAPTLPTPVILTGRHQPAALARRANVDRASGRCPADRLDFPAGCSARI